MPKPVEVKPLDNYLLWIKFSDGVVGVVDLSEFAGKGVFERWNDYVSFKKSISSQMARLRGAMKLTCARMHST